MNKELEALKKHYIQLANNSNFKYTDFEENRFKLLEQELEQKEKLEKAFNALSKEDEKTKKLLSLEIEKNRAFEIIKENLNIDEILFAIKGVCKASDYDLVKEMLENDK